MGIMSLISQAKSKVRHYKYSQEVKAEGDLMRLKYERQQLEKKVNIKNNIMKEKEKIIKLKGQSSSLFGNNSFNDKLKKKKGKYEGFSFN